jgi:hypothetical protein
LVALTSSPNRGKRHFANFRGQLMRLPGFAAFVRSGSRGKRKTNPMAEAHAKPNHDYHLVDPSPWPIVGAVAAFVLAAGAILWMKHISFGGIKPGSYVFGAGLLGIL